MKTVKPVFQPPPEEPDEDKEEKMRQIQAALSMLMAPKVEDADEKRRIVHVNINQSQSSQQSKKTAKTVAASPRAPLEEKPKTPENKEPEKSVEEP